MLLSRVMSWRLSVVVVGVALSSAHASGALEIGSPNTVRAEPPLRRPATLPCVVPLFDALVFDNFSPRAFAYQPPKACAGTWSKVVLEVDLSVSAGRQFDRTATIFIGGTNVYFGTTSEPSALVAPSWHIERDLSEYPPLFRQPQAGQVLIENVVDTTYTGILSGSARLLFYPAGRGERPARSVDVVLPLSAGPTGGVVFVASSTDRLARTFTLPRNVERAYLDVIAQSQAADEFWFTCVPTELSAQLQSCGGTGFRETEVAIDGQPAGIAPVYPWLYTGAVDPGLWRPIHGVQTLDFEPYRVDLTPFAALLSDGQPHEIALGVFNAADHFSITATLLLELDHGTAQVTGKLTRNTLAALPAPVVTQDISTSPDGSVSGSVDVSASRRYEIAGLVRTSHGVVSTRVTQRIDFTNDQTFDISAARYEQSIAQRTRIEASTQVTQYGLTRERRTEQSWPLDLRYAYDVAADGSAMQTTTVRQGLERRGTGRYFGLPFKLEVLANTVRSADTLHFNAAGGFTGRTDQVASQRYFQTDAHGACYSREIAADKGVLSSVVDGRGCSNSR